MPMLFRAKSLTHAHQLLLTAIAAWFSHCKWPWLKKRLIDYFIANHPVRLDEAQRSTPDQYSCFNDFFTRKLKTGVRPLHPHGIVSPVDGIVSQVGRIHHSTLIQAKGQDYNLQALLGGQTDLASRFEHGMFLTLYLAPHHYHRVHMPYGGQLQRMSYIPGELYSVNQQSVQNTPNLFSRNERIVCYFKTDLGPMAVIMVGATLVGTMSTSWSGIVGKNHNGSIHHVDYSQADKTLRKGAEMGCFHFGSTVILLLNHPNLDLVDSLYPEQEITLGTPLAFYNDP